MEKYVGIDVSLKESAVCIVDQSGKVLRELKALSDPDALGRILRAEGCSEARICLLYTSRCV